MAGRTSIPGATVTGRIFAVLGTFTAERPHQSLTEVSRRSGLPLSTTRRLVGELVTQGALERLPSGTYRVGIRLWQLGSTAPRQRGLRDAALPTMNDLYESTRENVELMVLDGTSALCVEKVHGRGPVLSRTRVGGSVPLHASSVGKVLLAFSAGEVLERTIDRGLERRTPLTLVEPGRLAAALTDVRRSRVAFARQEMALGRVAVASPVVDRATGEVVAALGVIARAGTSLERLAPAVRTAALGISRVLR